MRAATLEELALEPSLRRLVDEFAQATGLHVQLTISPDGTGALAPEVTHAVYRAVQEGLTNVQRHAQATTVDILLDRSAESIVLEIKDNGVGLPGASNGHQPESGGYGLIGLRERVALLDGQLSSGPSSGGGWCLHISLPLQQHSVFRAPEHIAGGSSGSSG
jgi:signal transduction histidine kinase